MNKKNFYLTLTCLTALPLLSQAQNVGINNDNTAPAASAMLDIKSTTKGMLAPRMTAAQRTAISTPANGLMVFDTDYNTFWVYKPTGWSQVVTLPYQTDVSAADAVLSIVNISAVGSAIRGATEGSGAGIEGLSSDGAGGIFTTLSGTGAIKIVDGQQGMGKVLTSDADGLGTWKPDGLLLPYIGEYSPTTGFGFMVAGMNGGSGISGQSFGNGTGVQGFTGGGKGIYGYASGGPGVAVYGANGGSGTAGYFSSVSGLAIQTGSGGTEINGGLKITSGSPAAGKVLTSDANGNATWDGIDPVGFAVKKKDGGQTMTNGSYTKITFSSTEAYTKGTAFNIGNSEFTAPANGFYHFDVGLNFDELLGAGTLDAVFISLYRRTTINSIGGDYYIYQFERIVPATNHGFSTTIYLDADDIIDVRVLNSGTGSLVVTGNATVGLPTYSFFSGYRVF